MNETCALHDGTCKDIDNVRGLFKWGFGLVVTVGITVAILFFGVLDEMNKTVTTIEIDVGIIKRQIERDYGYEVYNEKAEVEPSG